jgi:hypothetical protein
VSLSSLTGGRLNAFNGGSRRPSKASLPFDIPSLTAQVRGLLGRSNAQVLAKAIITIITIITLIIIIIIIIIYNYNYNYYYTLKFYNYHGASEGAAGALQCTCTCYSPPLLLIYCQIILLSYQYILFFLIIL